MAQPLQKYLFATLQLLLTLAALLSAGVARAETPLLPSVVARPQLPQPAPLVRTWPGFSREPRAERRWLRFSGFVLGASGVGLVALGGNWLVRSMEEKHQRDGLSSSQGASTADSANKSSERAWLLTSIGGGLLLGGVLALSIAPNKTGRVLTLAPRFAKRSIGLTLSAAF